MLLGPFSSIDNILFLPRVTRVAVSALASDWSGGRRRGKEGSSAQLIISLIVSGFGLTVIIPAFLDR